MQKGTLLTKLKVRELLGGVSLSFVNGLIARKKLPVIKLGYKTVRIRSTDLEDFVENHTILAR